MKVIPWILIGALLVGGFFGRRHYSERIAQLEQRKAQVDTVYQTKTVFRDKLHIKTDSFWITQSDTVRLLVQAERNACNAVIETCEHRVAIRDSIITQLKKKPPIWNKLPWVAAGLLGGVILTR